MNAKQFWQKRMPREAAAKTIQKAWRSYNQWRGYRSWSAYARSIIDYKLECMEGPHVCDYAAYGLGCRECGSCSCGRCIDICRCHVYGYGGRWY